MSSQGTLKIKPTVQLHHIFLVVYISHIFQWAVSHKFCTRDALETVQCWSERGQLFLIFRWKIIKCFLLLHLCPCGNWWCSVLGFVPAGFASSSSTLQIFPDAVHLWWFLCLPLPTYLVNSPDLCIFRMVQSYVEYANIIYKITKYVGHVKM